MNLPAITPLNIAENAMILSDSKRRTQFFASSRRQSFTLPDTIMFYITKNPSSANLYQKMIQSCKYFFIKNPVLAVSDLNFYYDKWRMAYTSIDLTKFGCKFWITDELNVKPPKYIKADLLLASITPKLYRCNVKDLILHQQIIFYADLPLLLSSAEFIHLFKCFVMNEDGSNVAVEKIIEIADKAKSIILEPTITSESMKELIKLPHFSTLDSLTLFHLPETFDIETFYAYMKKNKNTNFALYFNDSLSDTYKNQLNAIIDEILATRTFDYKPSLIHFYGINSVKYGKLSRICCRF